MLALNSSARLARPLGARPAFTRRCVAPHASKGFGADAKTAPKPSPKEGEDGESKPTSPAAAKDADAAALEALETRIKSRRKKVEAKVTVSAPAVDVATGKAPAPLYSEAERSYLIFLGFYFCFVLALGLVVAGSGFLPDELDAIVRDFLYPSFSWVVLGFLGLSSLYGLYKTGKLPGQSQAP